MKADIANLASLLCDLIALEYISKVAHCRFYVSSERSDLGKIIREETALVECCLQDECTLLH